MKKKYTSRVETMNRCKDPVRITIWAPKKVLRNPKNQNRIQSYMSWIKK